MNDQESRNSVLLACRTIFVPHVKPQTLFTGMAKRPNIFYGIYLDPGVFERDDLLLIQDHQGCYWWASFENLFEQDNNMRLHPCTLSHSQADCIVQKRVLFIADNDARLSDFSLLCQHRRPPPIDETREKVDLAIRHLASTKEVHIYTIDANGKRACDEVKTADYCRAKADIRRNPADTRNMRRFCNRQRNGEGPSDLTRRICHGYVPPRTSWSPPISLEMACDRPQTPSVSDPSALLEPNVWEIPAPEWIDRKDSAASHIMKLPFMPTAKLDAHLYKHELKRARREKKPESYTPPSDPSSAVNRVRHFCRRRLSKSSVDTSPLREDPDRMDSPAMRCDVSATSSTSTPLSCAPHDVLSSAHYTSGALGDDAAISRPPLLLPAAATEPIVVYPPPGAGKEDVPAKRLSGAETLPDIEILEGGPAQGHALHAKKDSLGEGIVAAGAGDAGDGGGGACESKAAFGSPGVGTVARSEAIKRNWTGVGAPKWIFNQGMV